MRFDLHYLIESHKDQTQFDETVDAFWDATETIIMDKAQCVYYTRWSAPTYDESALPAQTCT